MVPAQQRIVVHVDVDAMYVGCERELNPNALLHVPVAVSQYNPYGKLQETSSEEVDKRLIVRPGRPVNVSGDDINGSLIAVSYEARAEGVKRNDRGRDAVKKCPQLRIVQVPVKHGKADLTMYRDASYRVLNKLVASVKENAPSSQAGKILVEKASIDEIYIDVTLVAHEMAQRVMMEERKDVVESEQSDDSDQKEAAASSAKYTSYWQDILHNLGAARCTTVGGVEEISANALAANSLSKDEIRRGSQFQVLDSSGETPLDSGSRTWWQRNLGDWSDLEIALACGAALAARARSDVASQFTTKTKDGREGTTFTLSAGISTNKTLAKLASGMKKPNRQTLINPEEGDTLQKLFHPLPIGRIKGLGGKFGIELSEKLGVATVGDVAKLSLGDIERCYPPSPDNETAQFLFNISRGICTEEVNDRTICKSIGCGKTFRNHLALDPSNEDDIKKWTGELCGELTERLAVDRKENLRTPKLFGVSVHMSDKKRSASKSTPTPNSFERYSETAIKLIRRIAKPSSGSKIEGLTVFVSSFVEVADEANSIMAAFGKAPTRKVSDGTAVQSSWDKIRARATEKKPSLKNMWSQGTENMNKSNEERTDKSGDCEEAKEGSVDEIVSSSGIDPEVFSQLPPSIQAEIRMSHGNALKAGSSEKRRSGINGWLTQKQSASSEASRGDVDKASQKRLFAPSNPNDIDQDFLAELPDEIRASVMKDVAAHNRSLQRQSSGSSKRKKGIDSFFAPSKKK